MKKENKGITLIALVITIIVMLILVGVTITMAVNGGLFEKAGEAAAKTNNAIGAEQALANGAITVGDKYYNSLGEYVNDVTEATPKTVTITVFNESTGENETYDFPIGLTFEEAINQGKVDTSLWSIKNNIVFFKGMYLYYEELEFVRSTEILRIQIEEIT